ncbi:hypothetical protein GOP47_0005917 [Adiantum capillus-veneris]|uniref:TOD1/MUCI70 glycosyltransferase-like domain-containing protein n=1 Tax=Adiantum capillus-veneris TaxID=13818 RepID=A0A9D4V2K3_ADICA|nr:hypothetical protein GOP47_0005917 [Adiantum capillus-veneris]
MAFFTQGAGCSASLRIQDHSNADRAANGGPEGRHISRFSGEAQTSSRAGLKAHYRGKKSGRTVARSGPRIGVVAFLVLCIVSITIFGGDYLFSLIRSHKGANPSFQSQGLFEKQDGSSLLSFWNQRSTVEGSAKVSTSLWEGDREDYSLNNNKRALHFGKAHVQNEELLDRDSRYWDRDDRIRDRDLDYGDAVSKDISGKRNQRENAYSAERERMEKARGNKELSYMRDPVREMGSDARKTASWRHSVSGNGGLYNERGRKELRIYEEQLEAALKEELNSRENHESGLYKQEDGDNGWSMNRQTNNEGSVLSANINLGNQTNTVRKEDPFWEDGEEYDYNDSIPEVDQSEMIDEEDPHLGVEEAGTLHGDRESNSSRRSEVTSKAMSEVTSQESVIKNRRDSWTRQTSRKTKHRRRSAPCEINFLDSTEGLKEPETSSRFQNFSLKYVELEDSPGIAGWEPRFAGHQSLAERNQSFKAEDQTVHCGFVQVPDQFKTTGFDLAEDDVLYLRTCRIAVSSCIFGSSDNVRAPRNRKLTGSYKKDVCFVMFVDQSTLDVMHQEGQQLDEKGFLGPWKIVLVKNMPYTDARRVGKIPKFLTHRLFPAARYSIWLDSKLRLQNDPVLILEYFLWRGGFEYAISNHYDRHCVWEEVLQNKKLNKYNHTAIDEQFAFYQADGLTRFNASDPRKRLPSNVPEGSFIIRAHTPMSNLFSCLWFNEVDRFTSRDQLSFAYTYMKFVRTNPSKHFYFNMFKDCERKSIAKLFRHRKANSSNEQQEADI